MLALGGSPSYNRAQMLNLVTRTWTQLADMPNRHLFNHACGLVRRSDGKESVVVAGGSVGKKVSILDLDTMQWRIGERVTCKILYVLAYPIHS